MPVGSYDADDTLVKGPDGTLLTVKAASTAAVAADPSVVVAHSPNSPLPAGTNGIGKVILRDTAGTNEGKINEFNQVSTNNGDQSFSRQTSNGTTTVKSGTGMLHGIIIGNNGSGGQITIYDNTAGSGTVIMDLDVGTPSGGLLSSSGQPSPVFLGPLSIRFTTGLTVVRAGSTSNDVTILYR